MCGIAGIWYKRPNPSGYGVIRRMTSVMQHRGPDGYGHLGLDYDRLYLGHRRLSIIDLSAAGKQPMQYMNRYTLTYNGEIYNYIEIRALLKTKGYTFTTHTDTEVIMAAFDFWGVDCLQHFDGMFAFALYDNKANQLFCARDRFGEKPFHYFEGSDYFAFASEMKSLWEAGVSKEPDDYSLYLFINMDLHEDPEEKSRTFFKNAKRLKPSHYFLLSSDGSVIQKCYWSLNSVLPPLSLSFQEACKHFRDLLETSVNRRLRSDVAVGTSLSGGLDSSLITLLMHKLKMPETSQACFSARFKDPQVDEGVFMNMVINNSTISHFVVWPEPEDIVKDMQSLMFHQEEPFLTASIYAQWAVFRLAKQHNVTVLLDGQGADEILAGYTHFFVPYFRELYRGKGKKALMSAHEEYLRNNVVHPPVTINARFLIETNFPFFPGILAGLKRNIIGVGSVPEIHPDLHSSYKHRKPPFVLFEDLHSSLVYHTSISGLDKLLRFADRNSMAHSREVRLPFLSHDLVEFVFQLPSEFKIREGWTKALMRYSSSEFLPSDICWRKNKLGFQPPQQEWEANSTLRDYMLSCNELAVQRSYVNPHASPGWKGFVVGAFLNT